MTHSNSATGGEFNKRPVYKGVGWVEGNHGDVVTGSVITLILKEQGKEWSPDPGESAGGLCGEGCQAGSGTSVLSDTTGQQLGE